MLAHSPPPVSSRAPDKRRGRAAMPASFDNGTNLETGGLSDVWWAICRQREFVLGGDESRRTAWERGSWGVGASGPAAVNRSFLGEMSQPVPTVRPAAAGAAPHSPGGGNGAPNSRREPVGPPG